MTRLAAALLGTATLLSAAPAAPQAQRGTAGWRTGAVCYEVFVRSFYDSDGDGVGDLRGLIEKLDYVNDGNPETEDDLGARCIWLLPIAVSGSYHGYDVIDYYRVDPRYGTNDDFRRLVAEAHRRGIRVLVDMVINHASSDHPFFRHALIHPDSPYREWFRWSPSPGPPNEWGGDNWRRSPFRDEYYYGFFSHTMPDLNWESEAVRREMKAVATFWLTKMGADGFRIDAVRHLMEEPRRAANVPRTHDVLREYAAYIRDVAPGAFTIGEVFDSTEVMRHYYPDQLDAYFAFEVADALIGAVRTGSGRALLDAVVEVEEAVPDQRWSPFLRNHDQTRTMYELAGDEARAGLAATILLTLPGLPFVYYGEEIGMTGEKPDPRLRTPMHWSLGPAAGFTTGVPWEPLQDDSLTANVEAMNRDPASLLSRYRRLIRLRDRSSALARGDFVPVHGGVEQVAAYLRRTEAEVILVVANLGNTVGSRVALSADGAVLPEGEYRASELLGGGEAAALRVGPDGRMVGYVPLPLLAPFEAYVIELRR
jgi:glycosidase